MKWWSELADCGRCFSRCDEVRVRYDLPTRRDLVWFGLSPGEGADLHSGLVGAKSQDGTLDVSDFLQPGLNLERR